MLTWSVERGVIRELRMQAQNLILPWGIETADSLGFFSLEHGIGYRHERVSEECSASEASSKATTVVRMPEGLWQLHLDDRIESSSCLSRSATLTGLEDTILMDFVMRFRFRRELFHSAEIAGRTIRHCASDVYHQYPVRSARLIGDFCSIRIEVDESLCGNEMAPMLYVRDHADEWVIHARMIPKRFRKEVIKLCNGWAGTRPLPMWASRALLAMPGLRSFLWYRNERKPYPRLIRRLFNPNAFPMAQLPRGQSLRWNVRMHVT